MNIRVTTDPMTMHDVTDLEHHPCVYEGDGENGLEIYFESEETRREFLAWECEDDHHISLMGNDSEDYVAEG